jgi:hypothetical protein
MKRYATKFKEKGTLANLTFTTSQEQEIISIAGHIGLLLMERYVALATLDNPNLEDSNLATMLAVSPRTIRATRTKLTEAHWFKRTSYKGDHPHITYDIGPKAVRAKSRANVRLANNEQATFIRENPKIVALMS